MDAFEAAARRQLVVRLVARLAEAIRTGDDEVIDLTREVLGRRRPR